MLINSTEHKNLVHFLSLCRKGTPTEVYAHIIHYDYNADYLNKEHPAIHRGPLYGYLPNHPLSEACIGNNLETAKFLLEFGLDPDPDIKWGQFKLSPPRQYAIGKPQFIKLFAGNGDERPWWRFSVSTEGKMTGLWPMAPTHLHLPKAALLIWHIMRGLRLYTPEMLLHDDFCKYPAVIQEFICRLGIKREEFETYKEWLAAHNADEKLLDIFRMAWYPCSEKARKTLDNLLISSNLLERNRLFALVIALLPPHDLVSLIMEFQEQFETSDDKEHIKEAMELLLGAMVTQCPE